MDGERGFTLLETMVALIIFALAAGALGQMIATGLSAGRQADALWTVTNLARSALARQGADEALEEGSLTGQWEGGFGWRRDVRLFADGDTLVTAEVAVTVWKQPAGPSVTLTTLRLAPTIQGARP